MDLVKDPADPQRCQAATRNGQWWGVRVEGSDYCRGHARGHIPMPSGMRLLLLAKAQDRARLAELAEHDDIKSLRDEIALTRMMVERLWNSAQSDAEQLAVYGRVNSHILTLERLVKTLQSDRRAAGQPAGEADALACRAADMPEARGTASQGLPNYEQLVDTLIRDVITTIQEARNERRPCPPFRPRRSPNAIACLVCVRSHRHLSRRGPLRRLLGERSRSATTIQSPRRKSSTTVTERPRCSRCSQATDRPLAG